MKNLRKLFLLLVGLMNGLFVSGSNNKEEGRVVSYKEEQWIIDRYAENYKSARSDHDKLHINSLLSRHSPKDFQQILNDVNAPAGHSYQEFQPYKKRALFDCKRSSKTPLELKKKLSYPWGLQWLAVVSIKIMDQFESDSDIIFVMPADEYFKRQAEAHLAAMMAKAHIDYKAAQNDLTQHQKDRALREVIRKAQSVKLPNNTYLSSTVRTRDELLAAVNAKVKQISKQDWETAVLINDQNEFDSYDQLELSKHIYSVHNKKDLVDSTSFSCSLEKRNEFCKKLYLNYLEGETRATQIARLKKENPIDFNPQTNKFAALFDKMSINQK